MKQSKKKKKLQKKDNKYTNKDNKFKYNTDYSKYRSYCQCHIKNFDYLNKKYECFKINQRKINYFIKKLKKTKKLEQLSFDDKTIIHYAVKYKNFSIIKSLTKNGANINAIDSNGETVIWEAIAQRNFKLIKFLIEKGANINIHSRHKIPLLHILPYHLNRTQIKYLTNKGLNLNLKDQKGFNILADAIESNYIGSFKLFLELGADIKDVDNKSISVLEKVLSSNNKELIDYVIYDYNLLYDDFVKDIIHKNNLIDIKKLFDNKISKEKLDQTLPEKGYKEKKHKI